MTCIRTHNCSRRPGFTLVELIVSMSVMSLLLLGMASAVSLARRAIPSQQSLSTTALSAGQAADFLAGDLMCALTLVHASATEVEFTVSDRDGQVPTPDVIHYSWQGSGSPLVREINGQSAGSILSDVREFQLTYVTGLNSATPPQTVVYAVKCVLRAGPDVKSRITTTFRALNEPGVPAS